MLVTLKEILGIAEEKGIAIGAFDAPNMTTVNAVVKAAEELNQPLILMHLQFHEEVGLCKIEEIVPVMLMYAKNASVPVCVHLDHGSDINYVQKCLDLGFTSVMYDGSMLSYEENVKNTKIVVEKARKTGASVEAEIGSMGKREGGDSGVMANGENDDKANEISIYTDPAIAEKFVAETGIDALACAFGTVHGFYKAEPKLDFDRISEIKKLINIPIVMHGGSGISYDDYREVIKRGVRKINYYTYMAAAGANAISNKKYSQFHDALLDAERAMKADVKRVLSIFSESK